jgi:pimeloyl-ACP methyl ester carboxylesterase
MSPLFVYEEGRGPNLILLHGFCETHEIWNDFVKPLSSQFHVLMPDLPGFGRSAPLPSPFTIDDVGEAIAAWLTEQEITSSIVIGHSLGGYVALSLAVNHPGLLKGFGLFHSTSFADSPEKKENRNRVVEFVRKNGAAPFIETFVPGLFFDKSHPAIAGVYRIASQTSPQAIIGYSEAMRDRPDRSSMLAENEVPKLLLAGREDTLVPLHTSREMAEKSKNCRFYEFPETAHMGFFEAKTGCQMAIKSFAEQVFFNK